MKQVTTDAIMLKRLNFGEADRIITMITSSEGKVSILAKGVRRSKSKLAGGLELFSLSTITYIDGKSDLKTVIGTRLKAHYGHIVSDISRTMLGYDLLKTIDSYTEHADEPAYFTVLHVALESLQDTSQDGYVVSAWFFMAVLQLYGGSLNIETPLGGEQFSSDEQYDFSYDDMSFFAHQRGVFSPNHIKLLRLIVRAKTPSQLSTVVGGAELAKPLAELLKQATSMHKT